MYYFLVQRLSQEQRERLDLELTTVPIPDEPQAPRWWRSDEAAMNASIAMAKALGMRVELN